MIIGLDVGGTHTDVVLLNQNGILQEAKVPTNHGDLFSTVLDGLDRITRHLEELSRIRGVILSTTLTTNAIVQKTIPQVGIITTAGPGIDPHHYQIGDHYHVVAGAIDHRGRETKALDVAAVEAAAAKLTSHGIENVAVVGKFSVRNPAHEEHIADILRPDFKSVFLGHQIAGSLNFPRRLATTYLNAAVYPVHKLFFESVRNSLEAKGIQVPIRILKADGGNMNLTASLQYPGQTIASGPAASIMGAVGFAPPDQDCLVLDIGGTTTDLAVLIGQVPLLEPLGSQVGDYKTLIRSLDTWSIGIGGDSHVRIQGDQIHIGPLRHGPAMAFGGRQPTPTDALVVLGKIPEGDRSRALAGIEPLADQLNLSVPETADRIFEKMCGTIARSMDRKIAAINSKPVYTIHEFCEGYQVKPLHLLVLGGPAPYFAERLGQMTRMNNAEAVPKWSVANAIGAALSRTTSQLTLFADTEQQRAVAPTENFRKRISKDYTLTEAVEQAYELLREKVLARGANPDHLEMDVIEQMQLNMVRGFNAKGRNIRVKVQIKPGLIHGYEKIIDSLRKDSSPSPLHPSHKDPRHA